MAIPPLLLLLLPLLLRGSAALPAPPRGGDTCGLWGPSTSRTNSDLGLGGSEQDTENSTSWTKSAEGRLCPHWPDTPTLQAWDPLDQAWSPQLPPGSGSGTSFSEPAIPAVKGTQRRP
uniref:Uncharacterized protein n=1 Tax=Ursus americanus TaxID=9643 RepID=A0A452S915_URSAM